MPIVISGNHYYFLDNYSFENMEIHRKNCSKIGKKVLDGHFWVEVDGKIVEDSVWMPIHEDKFKICNYQTFYKPASELTQKLAIEFMYKHNETYFNVKRDTEMFQKLISMTDIEPQRCITNCLIILQKYPTGKIVFGSCGYKYPNGIRRKTDFCDSLPKNAVWWMFGCGNYKVFKDHLHKDHTGDGITLITIEN